MKLIGCDRCRAIFPPETRYTTLWVFDDLTGDEMRHDAPEPARTVELCPVCRADLDAFLAGPDDATLNSTRALKNLEPITTGFDVNEPEDTPTHKRQAEKRTCESCGHTGFRKFQKTDTGWCCWRCIDTQKRQLTPPAEDEAGADPDPEPAPAPAPAPPGVTARCQDCIRTYTLTGVPLRHAVEMHELKHGHIVNILEPAGAA